MAYYSGTGLPGIGGNKPKKMSGKKKVVSAADRKRQEENYKEKTAFKVSAPKGEDKGKIEVNKGITSIRLYETDSGKQRINIRDTRGNSMTRTLSAPRSGKTGGTAYTKWLKGKAREDGITYGEAMKKYKGKYTK